MRLVWTAILAIGFVATANAGVCETRDLKGTIEEHRLALKAAQPDSAFYYRVDHYAVLVESAKFMRMLEAAVARSQSTSEQRLLEDVRVRAREAPQQYMDLFAIQLKHPVPYSVFDAVMADAHEQGDAIIIDAWELPSESRRFVSEIIVAKIKTRSAEGRKFCTLDGSALLRVTDGTFD